MRQRFLDWVLGDYSFPKILVPWRGTSGPQVGGWVRVAGQVTVSRELLEGAGIVGSHRRWPNIDDLIHQELANAYRAGHV